MAFTDYQSPQDKSSVVAPPKQNQLWSPSRTHSLGEGQQTLFIEQAVQASIALTTLPNETSQSKCEELARVGAILIHLSHIQLNSAMLLCWDQAIGGRALTWQIKVNDPALVVLHVAQIARISGVWHWLLLLDSPLEPQAGRLCSDLAQPP